MYKHLEYNDVVKNNIMVMDQSALLLARDYQLPVHVFNFDCEGAMAGIIQGNHVGTLISSKGTQIK
jgi:uridylate kinase